jgi:hypothetical protein
VRDRRFRFVRRKTVAETPSAKSSIWRASEDTRDEERVSDVRARARAEYDRAGWVAFTATMIALVGAFQIINGLTAIFRSGTYLVGRDRLVVDVDYTVWGWVHIVLGVLAVFAAFGLRRSQLWARFVGVAIASLSALTNVAFLPANPFLGVIVIVLDVVVIYGIVVYGKPLGDGGY